MQYEPSKELIEQIASECCNAMRERGLVPADWEIITKDSQEEFKQIQVLPYVVNLPTIRKALELYENQPQWQEKPDKEGWYCVMVKGEKCGWFWLYQPSDAVYVSKQKGTIHIQAEGYDFTLSQFLKQYSDYDGIKFLYIPEPEPYKEGK